MKGCLQVITGSMFCGKTTELIRRAERYRIQKKRVLVVKYAKDNRYSTECIATHSGLSLPAIAITSMKQLVNEHVEELMRCEVLCVDEGQFIQDLEICDNLASEMNKIVIVAGLDSDYKRKPFPEMLKLIPLAENITKLLSVCSNCSNDGSFSFRKDPNLMDQEVIGGADLYTSLCRQCWVQNFKNLENPVL